jgi:polysaccharide export outer membrane protein
MRQVRLVLAVALVAALASGCARRGAPAYTMVDPATGQQYTVVQPQTQIATTQYQTPVQYQAPVAQPQSRGFELYGQGGLSAQAQASAPQQVSGEAGDIPNRGLFTSRRSSYAATPAVQQSYVVQYRAPYAQAPAPQGYVVQQPARGGPYVAAPNYGYASASPYAAPSYTLDAGDKLRITVFGQEGLTNSYTVDAGGNVNLPLIGTIPARGVTTQQLASLISQRLKQGYVREPHVSVEVETYRPFFILGEVNTPGQYPYVANMTAEAAIAIAGGFSPRANKRKVELTRNSGGQQIHGEVPLNYPLRPGDTVVVKERWF